MNTEYNFSIGDTVRVKQGLATSGQVGKVTGVISELSVTVLFKNATRDFNPSWLERVSPEELNETQRREKFLAERNFEHFAQSLRTIESLFYSAANRVKLASSDITLENCSENPQMLWFRLQTIFAALRETSAAIETVEYMSRDVVEFTQHIERAKQC